MSERLIKPLERKRDSLSAGLISQIREQILSGKLVPGQQLPTEQQLVASADVSRTVVREAVSALKADGLVITRQGVGAFVAKNAREKPFRIESEEVDSFEEIINILELRMAVDIEMSGIAASRRTEAHLEKIEKCLDGIAQDNVAGREASASDYRLHMSIAKATKNPQFAKFISFIGQHLIPPLALLMKSDTKGTEEEKVARQENLKQLIHLEHTAIVVAIAEGDPAAARKASRHHIENSIERHSKILTENRSS